MALASGQTFAGYTIIRLLGSGGMGEVYLGQHPRLPRRDALKLLPPEWSADEEFRARFNREADLASTLWHPHIVGVHDCGEVDEQLWISMDFVDGLDAAQLLAERYPAGMPVEEVAHIVTAVASALDYAHKKGLLHRDVKPANIMMTHLDDDGEQRILLTDFGIARNVNDISGLTKTNMTVGTVAYSAPEQLLGEDVDGRADQYALAATAYHLLCGSQLFKDSNPAVVISRHLNVSPPALADRRPALAKFDPVLAIGLAKQPGDRYPRCSDFARALSQQVDSTAASTTSARTASAPKATPEVDMAAAAPRRRTASVAAIVAVLLVAAIGAAAFLLWPSHRNQASMGTGTAVQAAPAITFESMRDFVSRYYADLPEHPLDAWAKLDAHCQSQTEQHEFVDFWSTIQSVTVVSVSARDATSVVAELKYVRRNGTSTTENRWLRMVLVNDLMLLDESDRVGSVNGSSAPPPQSLFSSKAIDQILLTADQLSKLLGVNVTNNAAGGGGGGALAIKSSSYGMSDHSGQVKPSSCVGVAFTAEHDVYAASDPAAIKIQIFGEQYGGSGSTDYVEQTAAVFSSAEQAQKILKSSQSQWDTCSGTEVDVTLGYENGRGFKLGELQHDGDLIAISMASASGLTGLHACQQALGIHGNVIVEARTCEEPTVPGFTWQDPVISPAWATPTAALLAKSMLNNVKI